MRTAAVAAFLALASAVAGAAGGSAPSWTSSARWSSVRQPKAGAPEAIGGYTAGCLIGGKPLPLAGPGFEVVRIGRHRHFGHPLLVESIRRLAAAAVRAGLPALLVGDLSQPRGGPAPTNHASHQTGLDADVAFTRPEEGAPRSLSAEERQRLPFEPVVDLRTLRPTEAWNDRIVDLLELAAGDPAVDRIFVNPGVKRKACAARGGAPWLARLRPWWGHHDHFHVRLRCPAGSLDCRGQPSPPAGHGCGAELEWWFGDEARREAENRRPARIGSSPDLPARCRSILEG